MNLSFHLWHHHPCPVPHLFEKNATAWQSAQKCVFRFLLRSWASPFIWNPGKKTTWMERGGHLGPTKKTRFKSFLFHVSINYLWISKGMQAYQASTSKQYWILTYIMVMMQIQDPTPGPCTQNYTSTENIRVQQICLPMYPFIGDFPFSSFSRLIGLERNTLQERPQKMMGKTW